jgi:DNA-directed RNA polymerase subunit RPC12/RpoP
MEDLRIFRCLHCNAKFEASVYDLYGLKEDEIQCPFCNEIGEVIDITMSEEE